MKSRKQTQRNSTFNGSPIDNGMQSSQLMELFEEHLKDILWAEKALIKAISNETNKQVARLTKVFETIQDKPSSVKSGAIEDLIAEVSELMEDCEKGSECDTEIISVVQKIKHYEIATFGTLRKFAETLGLRDAEKLLLETLNEENTADQKLTDIAADVVNMDAAVKQA